jgi:peroxiredoxin Q/BCP
MLQKGDIAPDFSLPNQDDEIVHLSDFEGKKVIVYFYPKDDTPACTKEACSFRNRFKEFEDLNTVVLGISCDPPKSHREFIEKFKLPFQLLSDTTTKVANEWGVYGEKNVYGRKYMGIHRMTFILDEQRKIQHIYKKVSPAGHASEVLEKLNGELCNQVIG